MITKNRLIDLYYSMFDEVPDTFDRYDTTSWYVKFVNLLDDIVKKQPKNTEEINLIVDKHNYHSPNWMKRFKELILEEQFKKDFLEYIK